ncbi:MAG: lysophospholipid acyltransferase family protein [Candidatus Omnitrophota bacterium]
MNSVKSFFFYAFLWLVRVTPAGLYFPFTRFGIRFFYALNPKAERYAVGTLSRVYGDQIGIAEKKRLARASFLNLADGLAGFIFTFSRPEFSRGTFDLEGLDKLAAAKAAGKGAVIGIAHFGPFAWMMYRFIAEGYKAGVVAKPPRGEFLRGKFADAFRHIGLKVILSTPVRSCIVESIRALNAGELLFMPVDQNYGAAGRIFVNFFGQPAATAPGPVMYAQKTGAPLLMAFALPAGPNKFKIVIEGPLVLVKTGDERRDLVVNTQAFTAMVEKYVRQYPEQWSWLHRRWKCVPRENEGVL